MLTEYRGQQYNVGQVYAMHTLAENEVSLYGFDTHQLPLNGKSLWLEGARLNGIKLHHSTMNDADLKNALDATSTALIPGRSDAETPENGVDHLLPIVLDRASSRAGGASAARLAMLAQLVSHNSLLQEGHDALAILEGQSQLCGAFQSGALNADRTGIGVDLVAIVFTFDPDRPTHCAPPGFHQRPELIARNGRTPRFLPVSVHLKSHKANCLILPSIGSLPFT